MVLLLIDDDPDEFEIFCDAVRAYDPRIDCRHAKSGDEAMALLTDIKPDHIFLDVNMPVMSGADILAFIKSHPELKDISVHMYSTTQNPKELAHFLKLGASSFLEKPTYVSDFTNALKAILRT